MATKYQMQAQDSTTLELVSWRSDAPDWAAAGAPPGGYIEDSIAVTGGGIDTGSILPANTITLTDGSTVTLTDGSYATTV